MSHELDELPESLRDPIKCMERGRELLATTWKVREGDVCIYCGDRFRKVNGGRDLFHRCMVKA